MDHSRHHDHPAMSRIHHLRSALEGGASTIEKALIDDHEFFPELQDLIRTSGRSAHYSPPTYTNFVSRRSERLPKIILDHIQNCVLHHDMGIFPEINRVWASVDNALFIWNYHERAELPCKYDGQEQVIVSVGLVRTKPGVFIEDIKFILVLCTPVEVLLLAVYFDDGSIQGELTLHPTQLSAATSVNMLCVCGTDDGRIFLGGADGGLYELCYRSTEGWFSTRCSLTNHSHDLFKRTIAYFMGTSSSPSDRAIVEIVHDASRHILYTRDAKDGITMYDLGEDGGVLERVAWCDVVRNVPSHDYRTKSKSNAMEVVTMSVIPKSQSESAHLVVVWSSGLRAYYSTRTSSRVDSTVAFHGRPTTLEFVGIRRQPESALMIAPVELTDMVNPFMPSLMDGRGAGGAGSIGAVARQSKLNVTHACYGNGVLLMADASLISSKHPDAKQVLLALSPDFAGTYRDRRFCETPNFYSISGGIRAIAEVPLHTLLVGKPVHLVCAAQDDLFAKAGAAAGDDEDRVSLIGCKRISDRTAETYCIKNAFAVQHLLPPRRFAILTEKELHFAEKVTPLAQLRKLLLTHRGGSFSEELVWFFSLQGYGQDQSCAMCLALACSDPWVTSSGDPVLASSKRRRTSGGGMGDGIASSPASFRGGGGGGASAASAYGATASHSRGLGGGRDGAGSGARGGGGAGGGSMLFVSAPLDSGAIGGGAELEERAAEAFLSLGARRVGRAGGGGPGSSSPLPGSAATLALHPEGLRRPQPGLGGGFSGRHNGLALYLSRLLRPVWKRKIRDLFIMIDQQDAGLEGLLRHLRRLSDFLRRHRYALIPAEEDRDRKRAAPDGSGGGALGPTTNIHRRWLSGPLSAPSNPSMLYVANQHRLGLADLKRLGPIKMAEKVEEDSARNLHIVLRRAIEVIEFMRILAPLVDSEELKDPLDKVLVLDFAGMVTKAHVQLETLVNALVNLQVDAHRRKQIKQQLVLRCPAIFGKDDRARFEAHELLSRARETFNADDRLELLRESLKMFCQVARGGASSTTTSIEHYGEPWRLDVRSICRAFQRLWFHSGVVHLCLAAARGLDPQDLAFSAYESDTLDENLAAVHAHKQRMYAHVGPVMEEILLGRAPADLLEDRVVPDREYARRMEQETIRALFTSYDKQFHVETLYPFFLLRAELHDKLIRFGTEYDSKYLEQFLDAQNQLQLLMRYYANRDLLAMASHTAKRLALAETPVGTIVSGAAGGAGGGAPFSLEARKDFLHQAIMYARGGGDGDILRDLKDMQTLADIQSVVQEELKRLRTKRPDLSDALSDAIERLNQLQPDITTLYRNFVAGTHAWPSLPESSLLIFKEADISGDRLDEEVMKAWKKIIPINGSGIHGREDPREVHDTLVRLGGQLYPSNVFDIHFVCELLEERAPSLDVIQVMRAIDVSPRYIYEVYQRFFMEITDSATLNRLAPRLGQIADLLEDAIVSQDLRFSASELDGLSDLAALASSENIPELADRLRRLYEHMTRVSHRVAGGYY